MSQITTVINRFDGGIAEDHRVKSSNKFALTKHFDVFTYPHKLVPHYKTEADENKGYNMTRFLYAPATAQGAGQYRLYGLGVKPGTTQAAIYIYDIDTDFTGSWSAASITASKYISDDSYKNDNIFIFYKDKIYFWAHIPGAPALKSYDTTGSDDITEDFYVAGAVYDRVVQPVHHPSDDIMYFFAGYLVGKLNDTVKTENVLILPSNLVITAACAYGNYLAIACMTKNGDGTINADRRSTVFLWDRDSSLTTLTERIDFGAGEIVHLASLNNKLIAVVNSFATGVCGLNKGKILIKQANGQTADILGEITIDTQIDAASSSSIYLPQTSLLKDNKLYFPMRADLDGDERNGIWVVDSNGNITLDIVEEEVAAGGTYEGIYATGNMWWIAHSDDGSINRTDDAAAYSTTNPSIYESLINMGDSRLTNDLVKKLIGVSVMTEPLPAAGQVVLKYRIDADLDGGSWTTIFTNTTDDSIVHEAINISGATLPEFREIQFRIESLGGAIITGLKTKVATIDKSLY